MPRHTRLETGTPWVQLSTTAADWKAADPELLSGMLAQLHLIRAVEETVLELAGEGLVHGPAHSSIGQEGGAVGSIIGPMLSSALMTATGQPWMLFATMGVVYGSIGVFGLYRTTRAAPVPMDQQDKFVAQPSASSPMMMQAIADLPNEDVKPLKNQSN